MSYILYRVTHAPNGFRDGWNRIAISDKRKKLKEYCKLTFGCDVGKPKIAAWNVYYVIIKDDLTIIL